MSAPTSNEVSARRFVDETTMKTLLAIPDEALEAVRAVAFQLYQAGRYAEAEVLCGGLVSADHKHAWSFSLYAATLRRLGRAQEALAQVELGLVYEPDEPQLLYMHRELQAALASGEAARHDVDRLATSTAAVAA
jgi:tetratricopeptide (TPR) repeat protein